MKVKKETLDECGAAMNLRYLHVDNAIKFESSRLKSDRGPEGRRKVSMNWTGGPMEDNRGGDLVRTWRRLMCHALAEIVSLISER